MTGYLIVHGDLDGIDHIVGLYDREGGIERMRALRARARRRQRLINHLALLAQKNGTMKQSNVVHLYRNEDCFDRDADAYCVRRVDADGAECVCVELGFPRR